MRTHVVDRHRLRTRGLDRNAFGCADRGGMGCRRTGSLDFARLRLAALRMTRCSARRQRELYAQRLADAQHHATRHRDARLEYVVFKRRFGAADAEHAVALPHRTVGRHANIALLVERHLVERVGEVTLVRPELQHVARCERPLGRDGGDAVLRRRHATHEHAAVVRAPVAHDVVAALVLQVGRGEPAGERLSQGAMLVFGGPHVLAASRSALGQRAIEYGAVRLRDGEHVLGRLHATLDLERRDARFHQFGQQVDGAQVLRGGSPNGRR